MAASARSTPAHPRAHTSSRPLGTFTWRCRSRWAAASAARSRCSPSGHAGSASASAARRSRPVVGSVAFDVVVPFRRDGVLGRDGIDRAGLDAGVAVDAFGGVDVQLIGLGETRLVRPRMDAVDWAHLDTGGVLGPKAWLVDYVRHVGRSVLD